MTDSSRFGRSDSDFGRRLRGETPGDNQQALRFTPGDRVRAPGGPIGTLTGLACRTPTERSDSDPLWLCRMDGQPQGQPPSRLQASSLALLHRYTAGDAVWVFFGGDRYPGIVIRRANMVPWQFIVIYEIGMRDEDYKRDRVKPEHMSPREPEQ